MGIGAGGGLPWKLPGEMKYFARGASMRLLACLCLLFLRDRDGMVGLVKDEYDV